MSITSQNTLGIDVVDLPEEQDSLFLETPKGITVTGVLAESTDTQAYSYNFPEVTASQRAFLLEGLEKTGRFDAGFGLVPSGPNQYTRFIEIHQIEVHPE